MIIGINGRLGSGKDLTASIIQYLVKLNVTDDFVDNSFEYFQTKVDSFDKEQYSGFKIKKFAYPLKQIVALLTGCTVEDLESQEFKAEQLGPEWDHHIGWDGRKYIIESISDNDREVLGSDRIKHYTYRDLLQKIGTEAMRDCIHEQIWVNAAFSDYNESSKIIFTDMRFPNEMDSIKQRGGITIRINRFEKDHNKVEHISETALDNATFDYEIDNKGSIEDLIEQVKLVLIKEKIINATI